MLLESKVDFETALKAMQKFKKCLENELKGFQDSYFTLFDSAIREAERVEIMIIDGNYALCFLK